MNATLESIYVKAGAPVGNKNAAGTHNREGLPYSIGDAAKHVTEKKHAQLYGQGGMRNHMRAEAYHEGGHIVVNYNHDTSTSDWKRSHATLPGNASHGEIKKSLEAAVSRSHSENEAKRARFQQYIRRNDPHGNAGPHSGVYSSNRQALEAIYAKAKL